MVRKKGWIHRILLVLVVSPNSITILKSGHLYKTQNIITHYYLPTSMIHLLFFLHIKSINFISFELIMIILGFFKGHILGKSYKKIDPATFFFIQQIYYIMYILYNDFFNIIIFNESMMGVLYT